MKAHFVNLVKEMIDLDCGTLEQSRGGTKFVYLRLAAVGLAALLPLRPSCTQNNYLHPEVQIYKTAKQQILE